MQIPSEPNYYTSARDGQHRMKTLAQTEPRRAWLMYQDILRFDPFQAKGCACDPRARDGAE